MKKLSVYVFILAVAVACLAVTGTAVATETGKPVAPGAYPPGVFGGAETCGCHAQRVQEWESSMHSKAFSDPLFNYKVAEGDKATGGKLGPFCIKCHAPVAVMTDQLGAETMTSAATQGISCSFCHQVSGVSEPLANTAHLVDASSMTLRAQIKDPKAPHQTKYSQLHETAEFCGGCHNVDHPVNGMHLEATYSEWKASSYAEEGIVCQNCHMGWTPGETAAPLEGVACSGGPTRSNIFYMNFTGANVGQGDPVAAAAMLKAAATVEVTAPVVIAPGEQADAIVKITNVGAGHYLPTGLTEVREMWLEVVAVDGSGAEKVIGERKFGTVLKDAKGKYPAELWDAVAIQSDDRIPPKASVTETVPVEVAAADSALKITARLKYRSAPEEMAKAASAPNPTTVMAEASADVFGSQEAADKAITQTETDSQNEALPLVLAGIGALIGVGIVSFLVMKSRTKA